MTAIQKILVVDDEADIRELIRDILVDEGYSVDLAEDAKTADEQARGGRYDLALLDIWLPDRDGVSVLREWQNMAWCPRQVIMISGHATVETAVEATRLGAYDFIEKPLSMAKLMLAVQRALEAGRLRAENQGLKRRFLPAPEFIGCSPVIAKLATTLQRVAKHDTWVLISGEAGAGKQLAARFLHAHSARAEQPFVELSPGAIPEQNAMAELFGREDGDRIYRGKLEQARGGVLYLDEVADMDAQTQLRLHGALTSGSFLRINGTQPVAVDVRVMAGTQQDLAALVAKGNFHEELYYQLNVVPVTVPALRERSEDVGELCAYFLDYFSRRDGTPVRRFSPAAEALLRRYDWPGNGRQLRNLVQRLLILGEGEEISDAEVRAGMDRRHCGLPDHEQAAAATLHFDLPMREARERFEHDYLLYRLDLAHGRVGELARSVGMERTHLYRKLRALGINPRRASSLTS